MKKIPIIISGVIFVVIAVVGALIILNKVGTQKQTQNTIELKPERRTYEKQIELQFGAVPPPSLPPEAPTAPIAPTNAPNEKSVVVTPPGQEFLITPSVTTSITAPTTITAAVPTKQTEPTQRTGSNGTLPRAGIMQTTILIIGGGLLMLVLAFAL